MLTKGTQQFGRRNHERRKVRRRDELEEREVLRVAPNGSRVNGGGSAKVGCDSRLYRQLRTTLRGGVRDLQPSSLPPQGYPDYTDKDGMKYQYEEYCYDTQTEEYDWYLCYYDCWLISGCSIVCQ